MVFVKNRKAPILRKTARGQKTYCHKFCPYSLEDPLNRLPNVQRSVHPVTSGHMSLDIKNGHQGIGHVCLDPYCKFYLGTATSGIPIQARVMTFDPTTKEYGVDIIAIPTALCSGTPYFEM